MGIPPGLPSGTVTFLFTDIEGSTNLVKNLGAGYPEVLHAHQAMLRKAFAAHGGHEVDTQGDSFFVAFPRARAAVEAAAQAQRALAAHDWPEGGAVRVRMGLHSGDPVVAGVGYTGLGVHRAARISAAGHGGQVLVSSATRELVRDDLPPGIRLRDLGDLRLKDMDAPERVSQLVIDGVRNDFPRLKSYGPAPLHRRPRVVAGAVAAIALVAALVAIVGRGPQAVTVKGNSVAAIDPASAKVVAEIPVGVGPGAIAATAGSLWVSNEADQTVSRIDLRSRRVVRSVALKDVPQDLAATADGLWVASAIPGVPAVAVRRIDPQFDSLGDPTRVGNVVPGGGASTAVLNGDLWVAPSDGLLTRLDPASGRVDKTVDTMTSAAGMTAGAGALWVAGGGGNTVTRVDSSGLVTPIAVGHIPVAVAVGSDGVWVANSLDGTVSRIDPDTNAVTDTVTVGASPEGIVAGDGSVWVASAADGTVSRIDERTRRVTATVKVGGSPHGLVIAGGRVWTTVGDSPPAVASGASSGTLQLATKDDPGPIDPGLAFNQTAWQVLDATCVQLLSYPDASAPRGAQLQPELATARPDVSADGRTYTYTVRGGFRFSPPSNQPVTAETFRYTIERSLSPRLKGPARTNFLGTVAGAPEYTSGKARHISGIQVIGNKLVIHLREATPDLPTVLSMPFFCAVPIGTPPDPRGLRGPPMAGPYYVRSQSDNSILLVRNPNYRGSRKRGAAAIRIGVGTPASRTDSMVEAGKLDYSVSGVAKGDFERIRTRYGGKARLSGAQPRLLTNPLLSVNFMLMNAERPTFRDARIRQAVNFAIDRRAIAALGNPLRPTPQQPTDQYLPPGMPGFRDATIYPFVPDLARAKALTGSRRRTAILYTCDAHPCDQVAQLVTSELAQIGITVETKAYSVNQLFARTVRFGEPFDLAIGGWLADYPDPGDFLDLLLLHGAGIQPPYRDSRFTRRLAAAAKLTGPRRYLEYGKLDVQVARESAPWAAISNTPSYDFFSARTGCEIYKPLTGIALNALCLTGK